MTTQFPLSGPMSVGDLLDRAFRLYRARFGVFLLTAATFLAPAGILSVLFGAESSVGNLSLFLEIAATALVSLAFTAQGIAALHSRPETIGVSIRRGLSRFWPYVGMGIVQLAAFVAALLVGAIPFAIGMGVLGLLDGDGPGNALDWIGSEGAFEIGSAAGSIGLIVCGFGPLFILFLAPFFYLYVRWYVSLVVLIAEGTGPIDSMRRSWHLSEGNFWRVFCYMFLLELLVSVLPLVIGPALEWIVAFIAPAAASGLLLRLAAAFPSLFLIISTPFRFGAGVLLYYDLRIRNEDYDLALRVAELEEQAAREADQEPVAVDAFSRRM